MRAALTVSPGRFTAPAEISRLLDPIEPVLEAAGVAVMRWLPDALPWLDWLDYRETGVAQDVPRDVDVIIGYELPASVRRAASRWIDLRRHPVRFLGDLWSVADEHGPLDAGDLRKLAVSIPTRARLAEYTSMGAFACQVSFDSAMMRNGSFIRPADVIEGIRCFAQRFEALFVAPHPLEPRGPWVDAARAIPNAVLSPWPTYELLSRVRDLCTVTSSVGVEAAYFGVETTWLAEPIEHGAPVARLDDRRLWDLLFTRAERKEVA